MSLSDLELVAKAMEPTNRAATIGQAEEETAQAKALTAKSTRNGDLQPHGGTRTNSQNTQTHSSQLRQNTNSTTQNDLSVPGIDPELLANLSPADLATLQPLINALTLGDDAEGEDDLDGLDENDPRIQELLRQMDVAADVADDLEGKLDKLIAALGQEESQMEQAVETMKPAVAGQEDPGK